jgi:hypothetical protein
VLKALSAVPHEDDIHKTDTYSVTALYAEGRAGQDTEFMKLNTKAARSR